MMSEEHTENGHITREGEEVVNANGVDDLKLDFDPDGPRPSGSPGINSPRHYLPNSVSSTGGGGISPANPEIDQEPQMEFFDGKRKDSDGEEGEEGNSSPGQLKDNDSYHSRGFAMISPSHSPAVALSSASADLFGEDEDTSEQLRNLNIEGSDEIVKPKPNRAHQDASPGTGTKGISTARAQLSMLKERCEDLEVNIVSREKVEEKESYIRYQIAVKSSRFEKSHYKVWRRYRDFEWLRDVTVKMHPTLIVPPLPGKQLSRYFDQKSESFLEERQHALCRFLQRMCVHPYFTFDRHLKVFLTAEPEDFAIYVIDMTGANRILGAVTSSVKFAANSLRLKDPDPEFVAAAKYFEDLGSKLGVVERIATRIHTEREELAADLDDFGAAVKQWSLNESDLVAPIQQMGTCLDNCSIATKDLNEASAYSLMMTAKEYQLYCAAGVSAVRHRDGLQLERDKMSDDREKKKKVHDEAAGSGKLQKLPKLADDLQKVGVEAERSLDELSVANEKLRVDIEKWSEAKDKELKDVMSHWAKHHVDYHNKCFGEWEKVLQMLRQPMMASGSTATGQSDGFYDTVVPGGVPSDESPQLRTIRGGNTAREPSPDLFS